MDIIKQIILPNRPPKNPQPCIVSCGDCGACALAGVLKISVEEAYELHQTGEYYGGGKIEKRSNFRHNTMIDTLRMISYPFRDKPLIEHFVSEVPLFPFSDYYHGMGLAFGLPGRSQWAWKDYVLAMLLGGFYGLAEVRHGGYPETVNLNQYGGTDHWITIGGWRNLYYPHESGNGGHYENELLILDSSLAQPLEQWIEVGDFLTRWGGFAALWVKPI